MATDAELLKTFRDAALAALSAGDYDTAERQALGAALMLDTNPDLVRNTGSGGSQSITWDRQGIDLFIKRLRQLQGRTLGVQFSPVTISNPDVDASGLANTGSPW